MAQLVARLVRNEKVGGSNPPSSTTHRHPIADVGFSYVRAWYRPGSVCCMAGVGVPVLCAEGDLGVKGQNVLVLWVIGHYVLLEG